LENNSGFYKELLDFDIKLDLRAFSVKHQFVAASFLRLNNNLRDQELKFSERYYKELRKRKHNFLQVNLSVKYFFKKVLRYSPSYSFCMVKLCAKIILIS
jgi:hypothetical protein